MPNIKNARIWEETVTIPTYPALSPDPNPMFFETRGNQGASGRIYPNPITDRLTHEHKVDQEYQAVFLENKHIQLMVLPRFGGRIHAALDKSNNYDFIYRQNVIKPGLIGLFGSWLSGGMEFNWPLHHRPSTFMPVEYTLEEGQDGSVTIWMSEHEPMNRMKGMLGVCLYPGKAHFELKVQLYNRTPFPQPFLWWINTGVAVNEDYQLIFPPDVESVTFHSRAFMADYPVARQVYAGLDWTPGVDISWPTNVDASTSYFANPSKYNFFGGYDHGVGGGLVHIANRHISPGKKLFTWGTGDFGTGWQSTLTDDDGPYVELMASAYSDNQPDFTWIQPYETKSFSQIWYPIQQIGAVKNANEKLALNLESGFLGLCAVEDIPAAQVRLTRQGETIIDEIIDLKPGSPFTRQLTAEDGQPLAVDASCTIVISDSQGNPLIAYTPAPPKNEPLPDTANPPTPPHQIDSTEELFLTGLHVEQYLHSTLDPSIYWARALELDPSDSRSNNALGRLLMRRGDFARAADLFRTAVKTLTRYNFNPYDSAPHYNLGLALAYQGDYDQAYDHFYKSTWSYAQRSPAFFALAQIDVRRGDFQRAVEHLDRALLTDTHNNKGHVLKAIALGKLGEIEAALELLEAVLGMDPLDLWAHNAKFRLAGNGAGAEFIRLMRGDVQNYLDIAFEYANAGLYTEASALLSPLPSGEGMPAEVTYPIVFYALGYFAAQMGEHAAAQAWYQQAAHQPPDYCFPLRLEEQIVLEAALTANPDDGYAAYYLGNLYYDKRQYEKAIKVWGTATDNEPAFAIPWRNLGIALYNKRNDKAGARRCYEHALAANPQDPRLLMEMDQLLERLGSSQSERLEALEKQPDLVDTRDDLSITFAELYSQTGQPDKAFEILTSHRFYAWEGGEGGAAGQYALAQVIRGQRAREQGQLEQALELFLSAQDPPDNLGVGRGMSMYDALAWFHTAETLTALGQSTAANYYQKLIDAEIRITRWGGAYPLTYYAVLAYRALGQEEAAEQKLAALVKFAGEKLGKGSEAAFFTSRPSMVVFDDDEQLANLVEGHYMMGLAYLGSGDTQSAVTSFEAVLALDPHHWWTRMQLRSIPNA